MVTISDLPAELLCQILSNVPRGRPDEDVVANTVNGNQQPSPHQLPSLATVSSAWQHEIERRTFSSISVESGSLPDFNRYMFERRRESLSTVRLTVTLPKYDHSLCTQVETLPEQRANDIAFTDGIRTMLWVLSTWEDDQLDSRGHRRPITFHLLEPYSPIDVAHHRNFYEDRQEYNLVLRDELWRIRYEHTRIRLTTPSDLPDVSQVSNFVAVSGTYRAVEASSIVAIATRFPNVQVIFWKISDNERAFHSARRQSRFVFAQALAMFHPPCLHTFVLNYFHTPPRNQILMPPSALHHSSAPSDDLSIALHRFTQSPTLAFVRLDGHIVISPSLFWPVTRGPKPYWPRLRQFHVVFNKATPSGDWYFEHPRADWGHETATAADQEDAGMGNGSSTDSDSETSESDEVYSDNESSDGGVGEDDPIDDPDDRQNQFRTYPLEKNIMPLLRAMARAAACMPRIECLSIEAQVVDCSACTIFKVTFLTPGNPSEHDTEPSDISKPRVYWQTGGWRPDEDVMDLWKVAAGVEDEDEIVIRFVRRELRRHIRV